MKSTFFKVFITLFTLVFSIGFYYLRFEIPQRLYQKGPEYFPECNQIWMIFSDNYYPGTEKWMESYYYNYRGESKNNNIDIWGYDMFPDNNVFYQCRKILKTSPNTRCTNFTIDKEDQFCLEHFE